MRRETEPPLYRSGTGSYYSESRERPLEDASPQSYFGAGLERIARHMMETAEEMRAFSRDPRFSAATGSYYSGSREMPVEDASPQSYFGAGLERISRQLMATADELWALSKDPRFPAATGSYYSGSRERPIEEASQGVRPIKRD